MKSRVLMAVLTANVALSVVTLGWLAWIVLEPRYWFENAYAEQGPQGTKGPRGDRGPVGPAGPVGPDAEDVVIELDNRVSSAEAEVADAVDRIDTLETTAADRDDSLLSSFEDDAEGKLVELCDAITSNWIYASNSAIETLLDDLHSACQ